MSGWPLLVVTLIMIMKLMVLKKGGTLMQEDGLFVFTSNNDNNPNVEEEVDYSTAGQ